MARLSKNRKAMKSASERAAELLGVMGYQLEAIALIGEDPLMHSVDYMVLGRMPDSHWQDAQFATWEMIDWSKHPNKADRERGAILYEGHYQISNDKAQRYFEDMLRREIGMYYWLIPGTDEPVPGCNMKGAC